MRLSPTAPVKFMLCRINYYRPRDGLPTLDMHLHKHWTTIEYPLLANKSSQHGSQHPQSCFRPKGDLLRVEKAPAQASDQKSVSQSQERHAVQDPPSYFRPQGGLLSFDMHLHGLVEQSAPHQQVLHSVDNSQAVPRQRTMKLDDDKTGHFNLVNAQIQQVWGRDLC